MSNYFYFGDGSTVEVAGAEGEIGEYTTVSDNLLDDSKLIRPTASSPLITVYLVADYYIPVSGHKGLCSNKRLQNVVYYDADHTILSTDSGINSYQGNVHQSVIPTGAVYARPEWWGVHKASSSSFPDMVFEDPNQLVSVYLNDMEYPNSDRRVADPHIMLNSDMVYGEVAEETMRIMKTMSVRALNQSRHAFRFGTLNQYVSRGMGNWDRIGEMLADFGVDVCGFQECAYRARTTAQEADINLPEHLIERRPWMYQYGNTCIPTGVSEVNGWSNKSLVSRWEVVENYFITWTKTDTGYTGGYNNSPVLFCKIKLPRYLDCNNGGDQYLGAYVAHFTVDGPAEVQQKEFDYILDNITTDECAFHMILTDSNAFHIDNQTGMPLLWEYAEANGFTGANPGVSKTVTTDNTSSSSNNSIDQIWVSSNIDVLDYGIVSSNDYQIYDSSLSQMVPLSDHDFLWADLYFDYTGLVTPELPKAH